jgi:hypothetical protein
MDFFGPSGDACEDVQKPVAAEYGKHQAHLAVREFAPYIFRDVVNVGEIALCFGNQGFRDSHHVRGLKGQVVGAQRFEQRIRYDVGQGVAPADDGQAYPECLRSDVTHDEVSFWPACEPADFCVHRAKGAVPVISFDLISRVTQA